MVNCSMFSFISVDSSDLPFGKVITVVAPQDMQYKDIDNGTLNGKKVLIDGIEYTVKGVETYSVGRNPEDYLSKGCNNKIGLLVDD